MENLENVAFQYRMVQLKQGKARIDTQRQRFQYHMTQVKFKLKNKPSSD